MSQVTVTVSHMTRVTWGPWESKRIATVVKCISSRKMSENSIEFSLSNSEQRDSWLNSGHRTLDTDKVRLKSLPVVVCVYSHWILPVVASSKAEFAYCHHQLCSSLPGVRLKSLSVVVCVHSHWILPVIASSKAEFTCCWLSPLLCLCPQLLNTVCHCLKGWICLSLSFVVIVPILQVRLNSLAIIVRHTWTAWSEAEVTYCYCRLHPQSLNTTCCCYLCLQSLNTACCCPKWGWSHLPFVAILLCFLESLFRHGPWDR